MLAPLRIDIRPFVKSPELVQWEYGGGTWASPDLARHIYNFAKRSLAQCSNACQFTAVIEDRSTLTPLPR